MMPPDEEILKANHSKVTCINCGYVFLMKANFEPDKHFKCNYCGGQDFKVFDVFIKPVHIAS